MSYPKLLVVLQNSYEKGNLKRGKYNPATWKKEFLSSMTGIRVQRVIPDGWPVSFANANPKIGASRRVALPPNLSHVRRRIREVRPDVILACGRLAQGACSEVWSGPLFGIPHPACPVLTNRLLDHAHDEIRAWSRHRRFVQVNFSQIRNAIVVEGKFTIGIVDRDAE